MRRFVLLLICGSQFSIGLMAADAPSKKRVSIPSWDNVPAGIFFDDAFVEALAGERPSSLDQNPHSAIVIADTRRGEPSLNAGSEWSKLISPTSIENEIKAIKTEIDSVVTTPSRFRGGGFKEARLQFTTATLMLGITVDYGAELRWQDIAGGMRDLFARAAANAKVGDVRVYNEAKLRKSDLQDLVSGARLSPPKANPDATWDQLVDRPPLMERLKIAHPLRLTQWTAGGDAFSEFQDQIVREAEIVAAIAHVLKLDGMEDAGDESYEAYCDAMKNAAIDIIKAVKDGNANAARVSAGNVGKACVQCHDDYRG